MLTETAIIQLKNRVESARQRATTVRQQQEVREQEQICNCIIDYYNTTENMREQMRNLQDLVQVFCEYIGINQTDIDELKTMDAKFLRHNLARRIPTWNDSPHWMFHWLTVDWFIYRNMQADLKLYQELLIPLARQMSDKEIAQWNQDGLRKDGKQSFDFTSLLGALELQAAEMEFDLLNE